MEYPPRRLPLLCQSRCKSACHFWILLLFSFHHTLPFLFIMSLAWPHKTPLINCGSWMPASHLIQCHHSLLHRRLRGTSFSVTTLYSRLSEIAPYLTRALQTFLTQSTLG